MDEFWQGMREESSEKRELNRKQSTYLLTQLGLELESKNGGAHLIVRYQQLVIDFWPGTGLWIERGRKHKSRGVFPLLKHLGLQREAQELKERMAAAGELASLPLASPPRAPSLNVPAIEMPPLADDQFAEPGAAVVVYADGACSGNPGPGGWGVHMRVGDRHIDLCGGQAQTTNNRMELMGAIVALHAAQAAREITLRLDSRYVLDGLKSWVHGWKRRGWTTSTGDPVKNQDLWQALDGRAQRYPGVLVLEWVRGHAGDPGNERADELARAGVPL